MSQRIRVIVNPSAGAGSAGRKIPELEALLRQYDLAYEIARTSGPGHATELARTAKTDGFDIVAVVGGDGTFNEVVQAYIDKGGNAVGGPEVALIPSGTGGDFKKTLGFTDSLDEAVSRLRHGTKKPIDFGVVRYTTARGEKALRAVVNIVSFGIGGKVDELVNETPKWLGGKASFLLATVRAMASYRNANVRVKVDGKTWHEGAVVNIAVANGRFFGAGMMIAPEADLADGLFDVVAMGDLNIREQLGMAGKIFKGTHIGCDGIKSTRGAFIEAEPVHPWASVLIDLDGEQPGKLPLSVTMIHGGLTLRV